MTIKYIAYVGSDVKTIYLYRCNNISVSHHLSTHLLPVFIPPKQIITLTKTSHHNIQLGCLCLHTKLCTYFGHAYRTGRNLTPNIHLPEWYLNH